MSALVEATELSLPGRLQSTSLVLNAGELVCVAGPNGSGKTSLLHALARIARPGGKVLIEGIDPTGLAVAQRQRLYSYAPAVNEVPWPLRAADLIALAVPDAADGARIADLLAALDLGALAQRRVDRLSTGERSRVLLARALAAAPKLILLDEPVANLDPSWRLRTLELLRAIARSGRSVVVAIHDLSLAFDYADRLIIMDRGRVAADGSPQDLLESDAIPEIFGVSFANGRWRLVPSA